MGADEYLRMLRRRMWWIIIPTIVAPLVAVGISLKLPNRYTSQTLVLVEHQKVPDQYVTPVVTEVLNARLATMQEQILSRTRLQPLIERFGLYQDMPNASMEGKVELMRKNVLVKPVRGDFGVGTGGLPGFYISFSAGSARLAQQVCAEITSMFIEVNLRAREQNAQGTTDFLKSQVEDAKRNLDEQDSRLAAFKQKYIGQLPGQEQVSFNMLASLNTQLEATTQAINRLQQEKTYTESMLSQQVQAWHTMRSSQSQEATPITPELLQQQLQAAQTQYLTLQARYTDTHPDVIRAKKDVDALRKRIDEASRVESGAANPKPITQAKEASIAEPSAIQQLRAQLRAMDQAIRDKQATQAELQRQIRSYQAKIQLSPVVEEKFKQLTRDHQTALEFYNQLLTKKNQSEMATDLERRQQGEQFRVLDPANLPERPTFPNRYLFAGGGFGGGLVLGLMIAGLLEFRDKAIQSEADVQFFLELPTLALVPALVPGASRNPYGGRRFWNRSKRDKKHKRELVGA
jgi:polysaccharide chain length determinant protein (PEP-CTERM system associated)